MIAAWIAAGVAALCMLAGMARILINTGRLIQRFDNHIENTAIHLRQKR